MLRVTGRRIAAALLALAFALSAATGCGAGRQPAGAPPGEAAATVAPASPDASASQAGQADAVDAGRAGAGDLTSGGSAAGNRAVEPGGSSDGETANPAGEGSGAERAASGSSPGRGQTAGPGAETERGTPPAKGAPSGQAGSSGPDAVPGQGAAGEPDAAPARQKPPASPQPAARTVTLSITGSAEWGDILGPTEVELKEGDTVADVLLRVAKAKRIAVDSRGSGPLFYVEGIAGLYEFDEGPTSGWKYFVNGEEPSLGAGAYKLAAGDRVEWRYVTEDARAADEAGADR